MIPDNLFQRKYFMNEQDFVEQYCLRPKPEPESKLDMLAREYYNRCRTWDMYNLSGPIIDGERLPADGKEMIACNKHANLIHRNVVWQAGGDEDGIRQAKQRYLKKYG
jgi:hypothetical protein